MAEDFNKLKIIYKKMVGTHFQHGWQFKIEVVDWQNLGSIIDMPEDFDLYVKDVTYCPLEVEVEPIKVGTSTLTYPIGSGPMVISMTMRDHEDQRIYRWFNSLVNKILNPNGTVNLPKDYLLEWRRYTLMSDGSEVQTGKWNAYPLKLGDVTETVMPGGFLEFPIQFQQFRSVN
jgi:hypothetical protein